MAEGRSRHEWAQTANLLCLIANVNRDPKKPPAKPSDFDPHQRKAGRAVPETPAGHAADMSILKSAFAGRKGGQQ